MVLFTVNTFFLFILIYHSNVRYYHHHRPYHLYVGYLQLPAGLLASFPCKLNTFRKRVKNAVTDKGNSSGDLM